MKTLVTVGVLAMSLSSAAWAEHHPTAAEHMDHSKHADIEPCKATLGKDGKLVGEPCDLPCCKGARHDGQQHGGMTMELQGDKGPSSQAYHAANMQMHKDMTFPFSGDADIDFLKGMIAHHQGAVDMAQVQLKYGEDVQIKRLAREIIRAQNLEIGWMKKWLNQLEANKKGYQDRNWIGDSTLGQ